MDIKSVGLLLVVAIGVIIGLVMLQPVASNVAQTSATYTAANYSITTPANGASVALLGSDIVGTATVVNETGPTPITTGYTISAKVVNDKKTLVFTNANATSVGSKLNVTFTYEPDGYIEDAGARSVAALIVVMTGLAIAVFSMVPALKEKFGM